MLNEEQLQYFCEAEARLAGVCVRIYEDRDGKELASIYGNHTAVRDMSTIPSDKVDFEGEGTIGLAYVEQFLLGRVLSEHDERTLVLGPVRMGELTESDIDALMIKFELPKALRGDISRFLMGTPVMPHENFLMLLSLFNLALNGSVVPMTEILTGGPMKDAPKEDYIDTIDIVQPRTSGEYEETIRYLIRNGMLDEIEKLRYESYQGIVGQLGPSQMRSLKNSLIILNSMCLRAAISGGLDTETAYSLGELYVQRIENAQTLTELGKLSQTIKRDYCRRVKQLSAPKIDNLYVLKSAEYVQKHIYERVTARELAEKAGVSPEYLSTLFAEHLKCSIPQYIARQKILEAKKLLRFTEKPLSEIAALLCFSSQSYFQAQFKKIRGITPAAYREKYRKGARGD